MATFRRAGRRAGRPGDDGLHSGRTTGGKYDGQLGVLCALEAIRTLNDRRVRTRHPVTLVIFTNEEGARFQPAMIASGVMAGKIALEDAYNARDKDGLRLVDELERIGYLGAEPCLPRPLRLLERTSSRDRTRGEGRRSASSRASWAIAGRG